MIQLDLMYSKVGSNVAEGDDLRFAVHVNKSHPTPELTSMLDAARAKEAQNGGAATDRCPACGSAIEDDGGEIGTCAKGHEWSESCALLCRFCIPHAYLCYIRMRLFWLQLIN